MRRASPTLLVVAVLVVLSLGAATLIATPILVPEGQRGLAITTLIGWFAAALTTLLAGLRSEEAARSSDAAAEASHHAVRRVETLSNGELTERMRQVVREELRTSLRPMLAQELRVLLEERQ